LDKILPAALLIVIDVTKEIYNTPMEKLYGSRPQIIVASKASSKRLTPLAARVFKYKY